MEYADYAVNTPSLVQLAISIALTAGISMALVGIFHRQLVAMAQEPKRDEDDTSPEPPAAYHLSGRIIQVTSVGFVFLFTFTVGQFVLNYRSADAATHLEAQYFGRALVSAQQFPAEFGREEMVAALEGYRELIVNEQWPLMERGDGSGAYAVQTEATALLYAAVGNSLSLGASEAPTWGSLSASIDSMLLEANDRLGDVPNPNAVRLMIVVIFLGAVSLAITAVFQPARRRMNLVLIGIMGATYGLLFYMTVELSNPFQGAAGIPPILGLLPS